MGRRARKISDLSKEKLWKLRQQVVLNSVFLEDYANDMGIDTKECCYFFDGYVEYLNEIAEGRGGKTNDFTYLRYDNKDNLYDWSLMVAATE